MVVETFVPRRHDVVALGRRIRQAHDRGEFSSFCASTRIHQRKAYDLIAIADAVDAGRLDVRTVEEIGWSKARLIAAQTTTKVAARRAIAFARGNTLPALVKYFQRDGLASALVTKSFHLTGRQAAELELVLLQAGARQRSGRMDGRSKALMQIVRAYRSFAENRKVKPHR